MEKQCVEHPRTLLDSRVANNEEYIERCRQLSSMIRGRVNMIANFQHAGLKGHAGEAGSDGSTNEQPSIEQRLLYSQTQLELLVDDLNGIYQHLEQIV
jgi:hypothetical protein